jgi:DNA-binding PadR family transcriptional regulator
MCCAKERFSIDFEPEVSWGCQGFGRGVVMELDTDRIDAAVLALLLLGLHDGARVWKTFEWDAMNRLHAKGFISDPVGRAKSVVLTEEGQREAERLFQMMFAPR